MIDDGEFAFGGRTDRPVVAEAVVAASPSEVFDAWTITETMSAWMELEVDVELRVGGRFEIYFAADAPEGAKGSEGCKILGYVPDELLVFSWNSPPILPDIRNARTQVGLRLTEVDDGTHVRLVHTGMGQGDSWDKNRDYFEAAWPSVLSALTAHFAKP